MRCGVRCEGGQNSPSMSTAVMQTPRMSLLDFRTCSYTYLSVGLGVVLTNCHRVTANVGNKLPLVTANGKNAILGG